MRRRDFLALTGAAAIFSRAAAAQRIQAKRLGLNFTLPPDDPSTPRYMAAMREGLAARGWVEGRNLTVDYRWGANSAELGRASAAELVSLKPDVLLVVGTPSTPEFAKATSSIPIVFTLVTDAAAGQLVPHSSRPDGNVTGFTQTEASMGGKWFDLLREAVPTLRRAGIIFTPPTQGSADFYVPSFEAAARDKGIEPVRLIAGDAREAAAVIADFAAQPGGGVASFNWILGLRAALLSEVMRQRLPHVFGHALYAADGSMITYAVDPFEQMRQAGDYAGLILNGAKVADLPVQSPSKYTLSLNLKTARAVGVTIPTSVLARADEVME